MTSVATRMSAEARDTRKRFWGALRALLVNTATTTSTFPTTVPRMMTPTTSMMNADATCECGGRGAGLGEEEEDVWLTFSREQFGGRVAGKVSVTEWDGSQKSILVSGLGGVSGCHQHPAGSTPEKQKKLLNPKHIQ